MRKYLIALLLSFMCVHEAFASIEIRSKQITIADGLPNNSVRSFFQDSKGFMWLGTLNGLSRYDGNSFLSFYPSADNPLSLQDRRVYDMNEDKNGFLWVSFSSEQLSCYDLKKACFVDFTGCGEFKQKYSKKMFAQNGDVWIWHKGNGCRKIVYDAKKGFSSVAYSRSNGKLPDDGVLFVSEGKNGDIWIGSENGLTRVSDNGASILNRKETFYESVCFKGKAYFITKDNKIFVFDQSSSSLHQLASLYTTNISLTGCFLLKDKWIILTSEGVYCYDFSKQKFQADPTLFGENLKSASFSLDNKQDFWVYNHTGKLWYINARTAVQKQFRLIPSEKMGYIDSERYHIVHDSRNIIWISTYGNGLFAYDIVKDELNHFTAGMNGLRHIGSDYLLNVTEDRSGEVWVSSEFSGISRISIINEGSYRFFPEDASLLDRSNTIRMVSRLEGGDIWMGTRKGGLYVYDSLLHLKYAKNDFHSNIYAVKKNKEGEIWMGSRGDGLSIGGVWYKHQDTDKHSIANDNIFCIYRDKKDRMWIGTFGGGLDLAVKTENGYRFSHYLNRTYGQRQIRVINEDQNGMIWIGTSDGVYVFDPDTLIASPEKYYLYNYDNGKLKSNEVRCLLTDRKGRVWIGTSGAGFSICRPLKNNYASLTFEHYSTHEGLSNDIVQSIAEDGQGHTWFATEYGISKFTLDTQTFENYFFSAYPQGNVYTENSGCVCANGNILFGSNYGFVVFDPAVVKKYSFSFPVVFTNLNVNGINIMPGSSSLLSLSMPYSDEIHLRANQNSLVIDFSSFNYADAGQTKYSYRLLGYDKDWSNPSYLNFAAYKMLPYGEYELEVQECNSSGVWNKNVAKLKIVISPPFYLSFWAFFIYALLVIGGSLLAFRVVRNFNRLHNKIQIEKQLTDYKLVFFTNISHEFRTPLTLIQGALERIQRLNITSKEIVHPLQTMEKSTSRMLRLIDQLLEFRKMQNNKLALSLEETDVIAMLYEIFLSFSDTAESKKMDFKFVPSVSKYKMYIDKGKLDKIVYNILSNAFKYTPQGGQVRLMASVDAEKNILAIRVSDTGVGIPQDKRNELFNRFMQSNFSGNSVGIGLHLAHELVLVHKGTISYEENPDGGSVFMVNLPLDANAYEEKDFLVRNNVLLSEHQEMVLPEDPEKPMLSLSSTSAPLNKQKILVIEDDNDVRQYLKEELGTYFEVVTADNGSTGFEMAQSCDPNLIVCDVLMPGMNGFEVTKKLKADFNTSHIPVILLTALSLPENHLEGIESGADAYLSKPFSLKLLLARIIKLLEQREKLRTKFSEEPGIMRSAICASERDKAFVDELHRVLEENIANASFSVDEFASIMRIGRTVFYKKVKGVTGYSPNEYIRIIRMKKAAELLLAAKLTVSEVSYKVGIDDPFYFSKCFKTQFGVAPSVYQKGKQ